MTSSGAILPLMADSLLPNKLRGKLLLADPSLRGSIFNQSVILIHDHDESGAIGLILNQPTGKCVGDFLSSADFEGIKSLPVFVGGPVEGSKLSFSSFWWSPKDGLKWAIRLSTQQAAEHARCSGRILRAFIGYSGWGEGQLEHELKQHSWFTLKPNRRLLTASHELELWKQLLSGISPHHHLMAMAPENFYLN